MVKRIITGAVIAVLLVALIWIHGITLLIAAALLGVLMQYEMLKTIKNKGIKTIDIPVYIFAAALMPALRIWSLEAVLLLYLATIMAVFILGICVKSYDFESIIHTLFTVLYPQTLMIMLYATIMVQPVFVSRWMLALAILAASGSDVFAYFVGSFMGKRKLCPEISPNKTVEGAIGGLVGGVILTLLAVLIVKQSFASVIVMCLAAVLYGVISQFGDLAASITKRYYGVKDFGSIFPGHGGALDRMCSILFVVPVVWVFFRLFI